MTNDRNEYLDTDLNTEQLVLEKAVTRAVLNGAKPVDVAAVNGIKYAACREMIHKHCKYVNREAYEKLNIDAAHMDNHSPYLDILRENKQLFIGLDECKKTEGQLRRDIAEREKRLANANIALRAERSELDQLQSELRMISVN
ncbi:hypothetical protein [Photobacterium carnosum]|uniref:hypothetical protein n=1 Tax=Photobacterium carnosum TaxID=2023717 RepID=UPI001E632BC9|nr:hypothetical protein [Photobacterium carnosum]MCD9516425.1 hypothetical protein [Photobacterium carnosum]